MLVVMLVLVVVVMLVVFAMLVFLAIMVVLTDEREEKRVNMKDDEVVLH